MSKGENPETAVLLPSAGIAVFTKDKETVAAAEELSEDWRFARVRIEVEEGDVDTAAEAYAAMDSPDLIVIQTESIDDEFAAGLETLASNCKEDTAAIIIGPVNDVYLYRQLIGMGVSDYLVKPVKADVLSEVIAKSLIEKMGAGGSHLIAVTGSKGGVGVSTVSRVLAIGMAETHGQKTMMLDAAGGWSGNGVALGFEPASTLPEAIKLGESGNEDNLKRIIYKVTERLSVLATGGDVMLDHEPVPDRVESFVNLLMTKYPVVVFDLSQAGAPVARAILAKANKIVLVTTPKLIALRLARTLCQEIRELRGGSDESVELVVNKEGESQTGEVPRSDIEVAMERKISMTLPFNPKLFVGSEGRSRLMHNEKGGREIVDKVAALVEDVVKDKSDTSESQEGSGVSGAKKGILGVFSRKT
jgi:pilus assembly protein CpaE